MLEGCGARRDAGSGWKSAGLFRGDNLLALKVAFAEAVAAFNKTTSANISTNPGGLVLDSFAGSGTTGAGARKLGRRWIMAELDEHCHAHIIRRLKKVIDGEDKGDITDAVSWKGGGGFRYYRIAPSLLERDKWGNWVLHRDYNAGLLAEALCKQALSRCE